MTFALRYAVRSDVGLLREGNEDSAYAGPHLLAVADGMGGYEAGEVASSSVIKSVAPLDSQLMPESELIDAVSAAVIRAKQNLRVIVEADPAVGSMGTTLTAMLWSGATAAICHIGDSRAYLLRDGDLYQVTRDHTFVQALIDQGRIRPEEAANHPQRSLLLRALDGRTDADPDLSLLTAELGDRFLLCSDGLPVAVSDEQILQTLADVAEPSDAVLVLIDLAIRGGGPDNITCIVADVIDTDRSQEPPTRMPVVAGAAASIGNEQTMQFTRPPEDTDAGMTRVGGSPAHAGGPAGTAPYPTTGPRSASGTHAAAGQRSDPRPSTAAPAAHAAGRTDTRPGARPAAAAAGAAGAAGAGSRDDDDYGYRRGRRRRFPLMTVLLALFVVIIAAGAVIGYQVVRSQYYVGDNGGKVAIFRGMKDKVLGFALYSVYQSTPIPVSGVSPASAQEISRADTGSLAMARQFLGNIRKQYVACQDAQAAVAKWKALKPKPIKVKSRINGKVVIKLKPGKKPPEPTIPSYCPGQT
ncbi:MAG TPA: protein phosphatase 2C domain-containing protein [Streptosporangiaceae bacterium]|jgi:protein phosphatase|nr:protein phosphatase 2C domain-containing protein [Streptosporangiaceae bacterium]